jgi:DNA-directed RNA polymerase specialized sigma24 family protein
MMNFAEASARGTRSITDFCQLFAAEIDSLYSLALLLTAGHDSAEACVFAGLDNCLRGMPVAESSARSWSRWNVITHANSMLSDPWECHTPLLDSELEEEGRRVNAITRLAPMERFAFVVSVLEGYSVSDCANLLRCTEDEVIQARGRAMQNLASELDDSATANPAMLPAPAVAAA